MGYGVMYVLKELSQPPVLGAKAQLPANGVLSRWNHLDWYYAGGFNGKLRWFAGRLRLGYGAEKRWYR